jgi:type II secretory pathway component GspD/PulD (secretin)
MKQIGQDFEVSLFEHNRTLFVAKKSDSSTRILNLGRLAARDVMKYLIDSQVVFPQFPLRIADSKRAIYVSGPTVYISLIKTLIDEYYDVVNPSNLTVTSYGQKRSVDLSTPDKEKKGLFK